MNDTMKDHEFLYKHSDNTWLLTGNDGSILSLLRIDDEIYEVLLKVQDRIRERMGVIKPTDFTTTDFTSSSGIGGGIGYRGSTSRKNSSKQTKSNLDDFGLELVSIGGIKHEHWRSAAQHIKTPDIEIKSGRNTNSIGKSKERGIIDGDLLEYLLSFSKDEVKQLFPHSEIMYKGEILSGENIIKMIEEFSRLH